MDSLKKCSYLSLLLDESIFKFSAFSLEYAQAENTYNHSFAAAYLSSPIWFLDLRSRALNSSFFLNWCNVNPVKIKKSNQLWLRGFVSIILNPFLRVFAISASLKVIHAPKTPPFRYPENKLPTYIFSNPCNWDFPLGI